MSNTPEVISSNKRQRGQAIILIAMGFIVLLAFTGLVVDVARVFVARGNLRRAVDSAGLAAAAQFRQNAAAGYIEKAAKQFVYAHGIVSDTQTYYDMAILPSTIAVETCDTAIIPNDPSLCTSPLKRKLVRVTASADVSMSFLQLVGIPTVRITANSVAEAAAVDVVLVIDASGAQANDAPSMLAYNGRSDLGCDLNSFTALGQPDLYAKNTNACIKACNDDPTKPCYPFKKVKDAAAAFIDQLYPGYDRVSVVRIDRQPTVVFPLGLDLNAAKTAIANMRASDYYPQYNTNPGDPCPYATYTGSPTVNQDWKCTTANTGGALLLAGDQFRTPPYRDDSLWTIILLSSSSADSTDNGTIFTGFTSPDPDVYTYGFCPGKNSAPLCRDNIWATHNITTSANYDAEDYAYDRATFLGLAPDKSVPTIPNGGAGILMFSIGLGRKVVCTGTVVNYDPGPPVVCQPTANNPYVDPNTGYPNVAESFLRYVAYIGAYNEVNYTQKPDPCAGIPLGQQCGNYYFAPDANGLQDIFLAIAGKIFTRISR